MNATAMSPATCNALALAHAAPGHTLPRCRGGFGTAAGVVTRRTANAMHNAMLAEFDHRDFPSSMTLTAQGERAARDLAASTPRTRTA